MPSKDIGLSATLQQLAEQLANLPDDHPLREIARAQQRPLADSHPFRKMIQEARTIEVTALQRLGQQLTELREQDRRELERLTKEAIKKKTRPPLEFPHLNDALDALGIERGNNSILRNSPKAAAGWVMGFLHDRYGVVVPDTQQRTIERRISDRFGDKSPR
jgi:hypothetical protein